MDWDTRLKTSKMDAFEERIRKCARDMEKVRSDYLKECSQYYEKNFNRFMTREKRNKMGWDKMKLDNQVGMHDRVFKHVDIRQRREEKQRAKRRDQERMLEAFRDKRKQRRLQAHKRKTARKIRSPSEPAAAATGMSRESSFYF